MWTSVRGYRLTQLASASALAAVLVTGDVLGQEITGTPGTPEARTTIDGRYLPNPPQAFRGDIQTNATQSTPYWPALIVPPKGAPNVLLIMTDDVGFAAPSTFGGVIPTPTLDRVAAEGLRYTRFHTTALCSPTRAALLTGRNHHSVGTGVVVDQATGYPGYNSIIPRDAVAIGEILRQNGYDTSWFGKDHNVPQWEASQAGPFTNWPTGPVKGFDYYYGFIGDDSSQWQPNNLFRNTTPIEPYLGNPGWNMITAMADDAIAHVKTLNDVQPDRPFMIYYAPGGTHSPHHPTKEWVDRISAMHLFDEGWNKLRDTIFANQKKLGVIPDNAELTPWPDSIPQWDTLSADSKKLFIRQADVYAAYLAYTDHEIGRVVQTIDDMGKLDNTLIIYVSGDNGASPEGTLNGLFNEFAVANAMDPTVEQNMKFFDAWGTDQTYPHYAVGWAWAWDNTLQVDQTDRRLFRRHPKRDGHGMARAHQGQGCCPQPIPPRDRHRAHNSRGGGPSRAGVGEWCRATADRGCQYGVYVGRRQSCGPSYDPIFRNVRQARHLSRRLDRFDASPVRALDPHVGQAVPGRHEQLQVGAV